MKRPRAPRETAFTAALRAQERVAVEAGRLPLKVGGPRGRRPPQLVKGTLILGAALVAFLGATGWYCTQMPGVRFAGASPPLTSEEDDFADRLREHVDTLARDIGPRGSHQSSNLQRAGDYVTRELERAGYDVREVAVQSRNSSAVNYEATLRGIGASEQILVVGAHLDSPKGSPGANANASGVAALLEVARALQGATFDRTVRFVVFGNGAPPHTGRDTSGASQYLRGALERQERVWGALVLDSLGSYSDAKGSQKNPFPFNFVYPDTANYIAFVGDLPSRDVVAKCVETFRTGGRIGCEGIALPGFLPGVLHSDHAPFAEKGLRAVMVTDTGVLRNERWGGPEDTADRIDTQRLARVVTGLVRVVGMLARRANIE